MYRNSIEDNAYCLMGYDGYVSLEMEDLTMSVEAGLQTSIDALKATVSQ